jgi:hypothetical protein
MDVHRSSPISELFSFSFVGDLIDSIFLLQCEVSSSSNFFSPVKVFISYNAGTPLRQQS